jgi:hypothetical protein
VYLNTLELLRLEYSLEIIEVEAFH